ncbi:MAG: hypothetical protein CM15mP103_02720 [Gammaproteobacteria bacterium]|nr:MAG: hypothetical protein CM15mP103_02720 [Gammaproteobacteria bacterium]
MPNYAESRRGAEHEINTCIACNQACLDHTFAMKTTSPLVNPRACHETLIKWGPARHQNIAVVGAVRRTGPLPRWRRSVALRYAL